MFLDKYIKILLIVLIFFPFRSIADDSSIDVNGSIQTGYKLYDNYSFAPYFDNDTAQDFSSVARIIFERESHNKYSYELHAIQAYNYSTVDTGVTVRDTSMLYTELGDDWIERNDETANRILVHLLKNINSKNYFFIFSEEILSLTIFPSFNIRIFFANFITAGS